LGKRGKNILSRKKILYALEHIKCPFTSKDMASIVNESPKRVAGLLKDFDNIEKTYDSDKRGKFILYNVTYPLTL